MHHLDRARDRARGLLATARLGWTRAISYLRPRCRALVEAVRPRQQESHEGAHRRAVPAADPPAPANPQAPASHTAATGRAGDADRGEYVSLADLFD